MADGSQKSRKVLVKWVESDQPPTSNCERGGGKEQRGIGLLADVVWNSRKGWFTGLVKDRVSKKKDLGILDPGHFS